MAASRLFVWTSAIRNSYAIFACHASSGSSPRDSQNATAARAELLGSAHAKGGLARLVHWMAMSSADTIAIAVGDEVEVDRLAS